MFAACDNYDDRYTPEYASVVRLDQYGEQEITAWTINDAETYSINILRSGHNIDQTTNAILRVMSDEEWADYAATYGLGYYYKLPANCFKLSEASYDKAVVPFEPKQIASEIEIEIISANLKDFSATLPDGGDLGTVICLPMLLETDNGSVLPAQNTLLLKVQSQEASLVLSETGLEKISSTVSSSTIEREYTIELSCRNPWGFTVNIKNDPQLLAAYNAENDSRYALMSAEAVEILDDDQWKPWEDMIMNFPIGENSKTLKLRFDPAKVGLMDAFALNITEPSLNLSVDPASLSNIVVVQIKPSTTRIKVAAADMSSSTDDGKNTAKNLVDGKRNTYFSTTTEVHDGDPVYGSYVDMKLPAAIRYFSFDFMTRYNYFGEGAGVPNEVDIYASTDGKNWERCGKINNMRRDFNNMGQTNSYGNFDAGKQVQYIRFAVIKGGASGKVDHREAATKAYWEASALYIYGK